MCGVLPCSVNRAVGCKGYVAVSAVGVAQRLQRPLCHVIHVQTLDGARELDKKHLLPVRRPVSRINLSFETVKSDVRARTSSDVQDHWAGDAGPIAERDETRVAWARRECNGIKAAFISDLVDDAARRRVQRDEAELQAPGPRTCRYHRDRTIVRESRTDHESGAVVDAPGRAEFTVLADVDNVEIVTAVIGGDEAQPVSLAAHAQAESGIRRQARRNAP